MRRLLLTATSTTLVAAAIGCGGPRNTREDTMPEVRAFFQAQGKTVVTFLGYSAAEYEDRAAMLAHAEDILAEHDPKTTIVNIGATQDGIGAVYDLARARGFTTTGIVSSQAKDAKATVSPNVDHVFFVEDATWGGFLEGKSELAPTSAAMVDVSDRIVAIGGGDIARDELVAARRAGKNVRFIPADLNHKIARDKAREKGQPEPTDFRGAAATAFGG